MWSVDFLGFSDASQATKRELEVKDRAWTFEQELDVAQHPNLILTALVTFHQNISSEYFPLLSLRAAPARELRVQ